MDTTSNKKENNVFAKGLCFYKLFWIFIVGCVVGVLTETLYCLILGGNFEVRWGVIYGPFNPVYGFGTVLTTIVLYRFSKLSKLKIFLSSMLLGGAYEYLCSFFQEITLGTISWNYEGKFFNLGGRTSLGYILCWGFLGLLWVKNIYPKVSDWIESFPLKVGKVLSWILFIFMVFNMIISSLAVYRYSSRYSNITAKNNFETFLDKAYPDEMLKRVYPNMKIVKRL